MIEISGWRIFLHPCFLDQYERLLGEVAAARRKDPEGYRKKASAKLLFALRKVAFELIPHDPADPVFRLGNTLGDAHRHWFRAKFLQQYRLFFRYNASVRIIVLAWVNDSDTKRAYGSSTDAYAVFRTMLSRETPPDDWHRLLAECQATEGRADRLAPPET